VKIHDIMDLDEGPTYSCLLVNIYKPPYIWGLGEINMEYRTWLGRVYYHGRSLVVTIPKRFCEELGIEKGDAVALLAVKAEDGRRELETVLELERAVQRGLSRLEEE